MIVLKSLLEKHFQYTEYISSDFSRFKYCMYFPLRILPGNKSQLKLSVKTKWGQRATGHLRESVKSMILNAWARIASVS